MAIQPAVVCFLTKINKKKHFASTMAIQPAVEARSREREEVERRGEG
jgi:hypothetical protein